MEYYRLRYLAVSIILFFGVVAYRKEIAEDLTSVVVKTAAHILLPGKFSYDHLYFEKGSIVLCESRLFSKEGVQLFKAERLKCKPHLFKGFVFVSLEKADCYLGEAIGLNHSTLKNGSISPRLPFKCVVQSDGMVLHLKDDKKVNCVFRPKIACKGYEGQIEFGACEPVVFDTVDREDGLTFRLTTCRLPVKELMHLLSWLGVEQLKGIETGTVTSHLTVCLATEDRQGNIYGDAEIENLSYTSPRAISEVRLGVLKAEFEIPLEPRLYLEPFFFLKEARLSMTLEKAGILSKHGSLEGIRGSFFTHPKLGIRWEGSSSLCAWNGAGFIAKEGSFPYSWLESKILFHQSGGSLELYLDPTVEGKSRVLVELTDLRRGAYEPFVPLMQDLFPGLAMPVFREGSVSCILSLTVGQALEEIELHECICRGFSGNSFGFDLALEEMKVTGKLSLPLSHPHLDLQLSLKGGELGIDPFNRSKLEGVVEIIDNQIQHSFIQGALGGVDFHLEAKGSLDAPELLFGLNGEVTNVVDIVDALGKSVSFASARPHVRSFVIDKSGEYVTTSSSDQVPSRSLELVGALSFEQSQPFLLQVGSLVSAHIQAKGVPLQEGMSCVRILGARVGAFSQKGQAAHLLDKIVLSGVVDFDLAYEGSYLLLDLSAPYVSITTPECCLSLPEGISCQKFLLDFSSNTWSGGLQYSGGLLEYYQGDILVAGIEGEVLFFDQAIECSIIKSRALGVELVSSLLIDFAAKQGIQLDWKIEKAQGELSALVSIAKNFGYRFPYADGIDGEVVLGDGGICLSCLFPLTGEKDVSMLSDFYCHVLVRQAVVPLFDGKIFSLSSYLSPIPIWLDGCFLDLIINKDKILISNVSGTLHLGETNCSFFAPRIEKKQGWTIEAEFSHSFMSLLYLKGSIEEKRGGYNINLAEGSHMCRAPLSLSCTLSSLGNLSSLKGSCSFPLEMFARDALFVAPFNKRVDPWIGQLTGHMEMAVELTENGSFNLALHGEEIRSSAGYVKHLTIQMDIASKEGGILIDNASIKNGGRSVFEGSCGYIQERGELEGKIDILEVRLPVDLLKEGELEKEITIRGGGLFSLSVHPEMCFKMGLTLEEPIMTLMDRQWRSHGALEMTWDLARHIEIRGIHLRDEKEGSLTEFTADLLSYDPSRKICSLQGCEAIVSKDLLNGYIGHVFEQDEKLQFDLKLQKDRVCATFLKNPLQSLKLPIDLSDLTVLLEPGKMSLTALLPARGCKIEAYVDDKKGRAKIHFLDPDLKETEAPLEMLLLRSPASTWQVWRLFGAFSGLEADMVRNLASNEEESVALLGSCNIDFSRIAPFIPPKFQEMAIKLLGMGEGYELHGFLGPDKEGGLVFQGSFWGKQFVFSGYRFQTMLSEITIDSSSLHLSHLQVSDPAGSVSIPSLHYTINKNGEERVVIEEFSLRELRPSLLTEIGKPKRPIEPLLIREATLKGFSCDPNDFRSCEGSGALSFINSFKRENTLFDLPAEVLGRIFGFDVELLMPVRGRLDFEIKEGRCYFTKLEEAFSENKRSQFFLDEKSLNYIDLSGELSLRAKMRQYVLFKITEQLMISVGGTVSLPKYSLNLIHK